MSDPITEAEAVARTAWTAHDVIQDLRRELDEEREVIGIIARERNDLRHANADLVAENAALRLRVAALLDEARAMRARRVKDWRGALALLWWTVKQGGK